MIKAYKLQSYIYKAKDMQKDISKSDDIILKAIVEKLSIKSEDINKSVKFDTNI